MNADTYIAALRKRNPKIFNANSSGNSPLMRIRLTEFENHLRLAFKAGELAGVASKSEWERHFGHKANEPMRETSLMEMIFGKNT